MIADPYKQYEAREDLENRGSLNRLSFQPAPVRFGSNVKPQARGRVVSFASRTVRAISNPAEKWEVFAEYPCAVIHLLRYHG
jgi:hypothetical protein